MILVHFGWRQKFNYVFTACKQLCVVNRPTVPVISMDAKLLVSPVLRNGSIVHFKFNCCRDTIRKPSLFFRWREFWCTIVWIVDSHLVLSRVLHSALPPRLTFVPVCDTRDWRCYGKCIILRLQDLIATVVFLVVTPPCWIAAVKWE